MTEPVIRRVRPGDAPELAGLWHRVFSDPEELALHFLRLLPELGGGVAAERDGSLLGAAYVVTDALLDGQRVGYLYAVGVLPEARGRGLGMVLTREAAALGKSLGAELLCTLPAEAGLYGWYEKLLGLRCALYRREELLPSRPGAAVSPLTPEEYGLRRERLLQGRPHLRPGQALLRFEKENCRCFGGDLLSAGDGLAAASREGERTLIRELLAPEGEDPRDLAAAVGAALGSGEVMLLGPGEEGRPYLAADRPLPPGCVWNLTLD